jgi:alkaline phosphatase
MTKKILAFVLSLVMGFTLFAQDKNVAEDGENLKIYDSGEAYQVKTFTQKFKSRKPKNIIFFIGDGMGVSQVHAALTANKGRLFIENLKYTGFSKTSSADNYITDSAAGGTALSSGVKTYNGAIGLDKDKNRVKTILEIAEEKGMATGLVSTSAITHATPASFIAHQSNRNMYEEIAADFLKTDIDVFIGGGYKHFTNRKDGRNLAGELKEKGYTVEKDLNIIANIKSGKLAGFVAEEHPGRLNERGNFLPVAVSTAINILSDNKRGFFLMVEGSQIDWGGHASNTDYIVEDMLDMDKSIGKALEFAAKDGKTLIVLTADHETGGMAVLNGSFETGMVKGEFTTGGHTGVMVPIFAYGPGAEEFIGIMENIEINEKMKKLLPGR